MDWCSAVAAIVGVLLSTGAWIAVYRPANPLAVLHPLFIGTPILGLVPPCLLLFGVFVGLPKGVTRSAAIGLLMWSVPSYLWLVVDEQAKWSRPGVTHWWITSRSFVFLAVGAAIGLAIAAVTHVAHGQRPSQELHQRHP